MHNPGFAPLRFLFPATAPLLVGALLLAGCGSDVKPANPRSTSSRTTGSAILIGTNAPASVVSFETMVQSIDAINASGESVSLISGTPTVNFARYNGLQSVLDMNEVPADTYTEIAVTFGPATISYLPPHSASAPWTIMAVFTTSIVTAALPAPLVVTRTGPVGIRVCFHLDKSIQRDSSGNLTGQVNPILDVGSVDPATPANR